MRHIRQQRGMDLSHHIFLAAEAAAHQLPDDTHARLIPAHHTRHLRPILIRNLRADINLHPSIGLRRRDTALRLHKRMVGDRRVKSVFENHIGFGKPFVHISLADLDMFQQISIWMKLWLTLLPRLHWIRDDGLEVELRFNLTRGLLRDFRRFRGYERDRVPHVADAFPDPDNGWPIVNDQSMIVFTRDIFGG